MLVFPLLISLCLAEHSGHSPPFKERPWYVTWSGWLWFRLKTSVPSTSFSTLQFSSFVNVFLHFLLFHYIIPLQSCLPILSPSTLPSSPLPQLFLLLLLSSPSTSVPLPRPTSPPLFIYTSFFSPSHSCFAFFLSPFYNCCNWAKCVNN